MILKSFLKKERITFDKIINECKDYSIGTASEKR